MAPDNWKAKKSVSAATSMPWAWCCMKCSPASVPSLTSPLPRFASRKELPAVRPSVVKDLDPAIERVILRCLETEPVARPANVLNVAAALPGGDPLAAALAAGETPSPQMVAAAGEAAGLGPRVAVICLAAALVGLAIAVYLTIRSSALDRLGLEMSPEVLTQKAREMLGKLGYERHPVDSFFGLYNNGDLRRFHREKRQAASRLEPGIKRAAFAHCSTGTGRVPGIWWRGFLRSAADPRDHSKLRSAGSYVRHGACGA